MSIITKIKQAGLVGRGGGCFPTAKKWEIVANAPGEKKYVVCNVSEGEPGVLKDRHILEYHMGKAIEGIKLAIDYLGAERAYIYLNHSYYDKFHHRLRKRIGDAPINVFKKDSCAGYIGGEETSALNHMEGKKIEPRLRPPYPTTSGLWGHPTLVNNLETFLDVYLIFMDQYFKKRFFTINGDVLHRGVYEFGEEMSIEEVLRASKNYPDFDFFVQVGGGASGEVLNNDQLDRPAPGCATITVFSKYKHQPLDLIKNWAKFFQLESCGQCTPCREGLVRLREHLDAQKIDWEMCGDILENLKESSFCGLGSAAPIAIVSYAENVLSTIPDNKISIPNATNEWVCDCLM